MESTKAEGSFRAPESEQSAAWWVTFSEIQLWVTDTYAAWSYKRMHILFPSCLEGSVSQEKLMLFSTPVSKHVFYCK